MLKVESRPYAIIVYGATGFSGTLTCEYATRAELWPSKTWCIAGRSKAKVTALQEKLSMMSPNYAPGGIQVAAVDDAAAMRHLATMCDVLLNCAGPYALTGEGVVVACLEARTHYVDITGEPQFVSKLVNLMRRRRHGVWRWFPVQGLTVSQRIWLCILRGRRCGPARVCFVD